MLFACTQGADRLVDHQYCIHKAAGYEPERCADLAHEGAVIWAIGCQCHDTNLDLHHPKGGHSHKTPVTGFITGALIQRADHEFIASHKIHIVLNAAIYCVLQ